MVAIRERHTFTAARLSIVFTDITLFLEYFIALNLIQRWVGIAVEFIPHLITIYLCFLWIKDN